MFFLVLQQLFTSLRKMIDGELLGNDVIAGELKAFLEDDEEEYFLEDQKVEQVMHELLKEINGGSNSKNASESCGPAFPGSGSTLMAGIEMAAGVNVGGMKVSGLGLGGPTIEVFSGLEMSFSVNNEPWLVEKSMQWVEGEAVVEGEKMDGCDEEESEDERLTRVLNCGPQVLQDYCI